MNTIDRIKKLYELAGLAPFEYNFEPNKLQRACDTLDAIVGNKFTSCSTFRSFNSHPVTNYIGVRLFHLEHAIGTRYQRRDDKRRRYYFHLGADG